MLYAQYCLNLLSLTNNVFCGCTCGSDRSLLISGCANNTEVRKPRIEARPSNQTINYGGSATFTCRASGDLLVGIEWEDSSGRKIDTRSGMLTISNARLSDAGVYTCVAYNHLSESVSETVRLYVRGGPVGVCERSSPCSDICTDDPRDPNRYTCSCHPGRMLNPDQRTCSDVDACGPKNPCSDICVVDSKNPRGYICRCPDGKLLDRDQRNCLVGACQRLRPCSHECVDDQRDPNRFTCRCPYGMILNPSDRRTCTVGACERLRPCSHNCTNDLRDPNRYTCSCPPGMQLEDERNCADIDRCRSNSCGDICINNPSRPSGYECRCRPGRALNPDRRTCRDVSICGTRNPCSDICMDDDKAPNGYRCQCRSGRYLTADGRSCADCGRCVHRCVTIGVRIICYCYNRDECKPVPPFDVCAVYRPCDQICTNVEQGYQCSCNPGYRLREDAKSCEPIDELEVFVDPLVRRIDEGGSGSITCSSRGGTGRHTRVWSPLVSDTTFDGSVFTVTNAVQAQHEREYTCTVTDEAGEVKRRSANVYIRNTLTVTVSPKYTSVNAGESTSLTCTVNRPSKARLLVWERADGRAFGFNIETRQMSDNTQRLNIGNARPEDEGEYLCRYRDGSVQQQDSARVVVETDPTPNNVSVVCGNTVTLSCYSRGGAMQSVSWKINDMDITNPRISISADGDQLVVPTVRAEDEGIYACYGTTGHTRTSTFLRLVVVCPPKITAGVYVLGKEDDMSNRRYLVGETAVLSCNVTGRPDISEVFWRKRDSPPGSRLAYETDARSDGRGNEIASLTHVIRDLTVDDGGTYECRARNSVNQSTASVEIVHFDVIPDPPVIEVRGGGKIVQSNSAELLCVVTSQPQYGPMSYSWSFVAFNRSQSNVMPPGVVNQGATLRILRMGFVHEGQYSCQVTDRHRQQSTRQSAAISIIEATIPPPVVIDVLHCSVPVGADYIRWRRQSGKPLPPQAVQQGTYGERLVISPVYARDADEYICCATNSRQSKEGCSNTGRPDTPPSVQIMVREPAGRPPKYLEGQSLHLECTILLPGWPEAVSVTWTKDGVRDPKLQGRHIRISRMVGSDQGVYRCVATNGRGLSAEDETEVRFGCVGPSHVRITVGDTHEQGYQLGSSVIWTCDAEGSPEPTYIWYKNSDSRNIVSRKSSLSIGPLTRDYEGLYTCQAINRCGRSEGSEELRIRNRRPEVPTIIPKGERYQPGSLVIIMCEAAGGFPTPTLTWSRGGRVTAISRDGSVELRFDSFNDMHAGVYVCTASNSEGNSTDSINLQPSCKLNQPTITMPDRIAIGDNITLFCSAGDSYPQPDYLWRRRGQALTNINTLRIDMIDSYHNGVEYSCEVSNSLCGQSKTETITLEVEGQNPRVKILPSSINPLAGTDARYTCVADGGDPTPSLMWTFNGRRVTTVSGSGNTLILRLDDIGREDNGRYTCVGNNRYGSDSKYVVIEVTERVPTDVEITGDLTYSDGEMIDLECRLMGPMPQPPGILEWIVNGRREMQLEGTRSISYRRLMNARMQGNYTCRAYNKYYDISKSVEVKGQPRAPTMVGPPGEEIFVKESSRNRWECKVEPGSRVRWIRRTEGAFIPADFISNPETVFRVTRAALSDTDLYYCVAVNDAGESPPSRSINITVIRRPGQVSIEQSPAPNAAGGRYIQGTYITLKCVVDGISTADRRIEWNKQGSLAIIMSGEQLQLRANERDAGTYECTARYNDGVVIDRDSVLIAVEPIRCAQQVTITGVNDRDNYVREGTSVQLVCRSDGSPSPTYSWYKGSDLILSNRQDLRLSSVSSRDMDRYRCAVAVQTCPDGTADIVLRLVELPKITEHSPAPRDLTPKRDDPLTLTCKAIGNPQPTITWTLNGSPVPSFASVSSDGSSLIIPRMASAYDGQYVCTASNRFSPPTDQWEWQVTTRTLEAPTNAVIVPRNTPNLYFGQGFHLVCTAEGEQIKYTWKYRQSNSYSWRDPSRISGVRAIPSGRQSKLNFTSLDDTIHDGYYQCLATNDANSTVSNIVNITVSVGPKVGLGCNTFGGVICLQSIAAGDNLALECSALGKPQMSYRWTDSQGNGKSLKETYTRNNIQVEDSDDYICTAYSEDRSTSDSGLFRVFVTTHPVQYKSVRAHSVCQVETPGGVVNITVSLKPEIENGLIYSYWDNEGLEVRLELQGLEPVLILRQDGKQESYIRSRQYLSRDSYTPIRVTVSQQSAQIGSVSNNINYRGYTIPEDGELSLMGEGENENTGLMGVITVLEVNGQLESISGCDSKHSINTIYNPCERDMCGEGKCVPAPTLDGYYCYCNQDGRPAMQCDANGRADVSTITDNQFIWDHFSAIFGRNSYSDFREILNHRNGEYTVGVATYYGSSVESSGMGGSGYIVSGGGDISGGGGSYISGGGGSYISGGGGSYISGGGSYISGGGSYISGGDGYNSGGGSYITGGGSYIGGGDVIGTADDSGFSSLSGISGGKDIAGGGGDSDVRDGSVRVGYDSRISLSDDRSRLSIQSNPSSPDIPGTVFSSELRRTQSAGRPVEGVEGADSRSNSQLDTDSSQSNGEPSVGPSQQNFRLNEQGTVYNVINKHSVRSSNSPNGHRTFYNLDNSRLAPPGDRGPRRGDLYTSIQNDQQHDEEDTAVDIPMDEADKSTGFSAGFNGRAYLQLPKAFANWLRIGGASFQLTTTADNGLVFYYGGKEDSVMQDSEYVALAVQDGYMEMSYRLSRRLEPTRIRSSVKVNDGNRHRVSFSRSRGDANLIVDGISVRGTQSSSYLGANGDIYIGGVPNIKMVSELYTSMFRGCISNLRTSSYKNSNEDVDLFDNLVKSSQVSRSC